jgi:hypothetical protein
MSEQKQTKKITDLSKKLNSQRHREASQKAVGTKPKTSVAKLPPGINNGVAQLKTCGFYEYGPDTEKKMWDGQKEVSAKGQLYFQAQGVVVEPKVFRTPDGTVHNTEGGQTLVHEPLFDTKGKNKVQTFEMHLERVRSALAALLGVDAVINADILEEGPGLCETAEEELPMFSFSTTLGSQKPQPGTDPMVFHNWHEPVEGVPLPSDEDHQVDETGGGESESEVEEVVEEKPKPTKPKGNGKSPAQKAREASEEEEPAFSDQDDLDTLVERAENDDVKAQKKLNELAKAAGATKKQIEDTNTWEEVRDLITGESKTDDDESEPDDEQEPLYNVGDSVKYKNPETKKTSAYEITFVGDGKVNLELLADRKKKLKGIKVEDLVTD